MPLFVDTKNRNVAKNGAAATLVMLKNARDAKMRPFIGPLMLSSCESSTTSTLPSPSSSADKTDNHDTFNFLPDMPDMRREEERLKTFDQWPVTFLTPEQLARNGFYYLGRGDEVCCAFCKVEIMRWVEGDDPAADHRRWAPQCPFVRKQMYANAGGEAAAVGRDECGASAATQPPRMPGPVHARYSTEAARLATFKDWPRCMRQKPEELAEAGFFYTGQGDKTKCFYCDGGLKDWESDDVPWEQHARWFDRCAYVQLVKGRDYIQKVKSEATAISASEEEQAATNDSTNNVAQEGEKHLDDSKICKICYSEERNVCFVPCGHVVACAKCALSTDKCPMCRRTFTNAVRLYFS
ncbi:inhibitor of apoptosis protein isoform X2 [Bombyx mori]|uniref:RING-type domain-containing protein n=1 Tax=Bombyx mori TaxID=7091 RepID=A0A8R2GAX9_BOMMO|nr:inhibitor of apoptosis protein isoform X2 [Bombyx mori]